MKTSRADTVFSVTQSSVIDGVCLLSLRDSSICVRVSQDFVTQGRIVPGSTVTWTISVDLPDEPAEPPTHDEFREQVESDLKRLDAVVVDHEEGMASLRRAYIALAVGVSLVLLFILVAVLR